MRIEDKGIKDVINHPGVQAVFMYGSRVYGTFREDSDYDYIIVTDDAWVEARLDGNDNLQVVSSAKFESDLANHEVYAIECLFLPPKYVLKGRCPRTTIVPEKIRVKFAHTASNSWSKFKKKIDVEDDVLSGIKSLFHSIRLLSFATDIIGYGNIKYEALVHVWKNILRIADKTEKIVLTDVLSATYRTLYNELKSDLRALAPTEDNKVLYDEIYALFDEFNVPRHKTLTKNIIKLFRK